MPMLKRIGDMKPGTLVRCPGLPLTAKLIHANECRAHVRILGGMKLVEIPGRKPFLADAGSYTDWSPSVACYEVNDLS